METDDPRLRNLRPYKKGQSGNPKGLPKGYKQLGPLLRKVLSNRIVFEENGKRVVRSLQEALVLKLVNDAISSDNTASERIKAINVIMDRVDGKPGRAALLPLSPPRIVVHMVEGDVDNDDGGCSVE